jgi:hypothetical protein
MGMNFTGLKPKSEEGKRFHVNNEGWNALINVLEDCEETEDMAYDMEHEQNNASFCSLDCIAVADAIKAEGSNLFNEQTKEYEPMIKEFAEFCRDSGGFDIC